MPKNTDFTLLYIEDSPANLKLIENIVSKKFDINMLSASTAEQGLKMATQFCPNLILMDINLPGMNGDEAFKILQADQNTKDIPVIALSANALERDIENAYKLGFKEYITKPINVANFISMLDKEISLQSNKKS